MSVKKAIEKVLFWFHLPFVLVWIGLFFIPSTILPAKIMIHFWYVTIMFAIQFVWALVLTRKLDIICPLTTLTQYIRGHALSSPQNYDHSYVAELVNKLQIGVKTKHVNYSILICVIIVIFQYATL